MSAVILQEERTAASSALLPDLPIITGLWAKAGSPPSPRPRLIRPTVRRLLRSPRLSGPGPHHAAF